LYFFMFDIQYCFICRNSDSSVSEDAGTEPSTIATSALARLRCAIYERMCKILYVRAEKTFVQASAFVYTVKKVRGFPVHGLVTSWHGDGKIANFFYSVL
jgi:hypothetical protein